MSAHESGALPADGLKAKLVNLHREHWREALADHVLQVFGTKPTNAIAVEGRDPAAAG
jgi:hypothetical protein